MLALVSGPVSASAALTAVDGGLGVYDATNNVTWTSDMALMATQAAASGNATAFVNTIISDSGGVIHDIPIRTTRLGPTLSPQVTLTPPPAR